MHPFQSGRALRIAMLERLITRMKTLPGVWFPTCEQVARYCIDSHPTQTGALSRREANDAVEAKLYDLRREEPR